MAEREVSPEVIETSDDFAEMFQRHRDDIYGRNTVDLEGLGCDIENAIQFVRDNLTDDEQRELGFDTLEEIMDEMASAQDMLRSGAEQVASFFEDLPEDLKEQRDLAEGDDDE